MEPTLIMNLTAWIVRLPISAKEKHIGLDLVGKVIDERFGSLRA